MRGERLRQADKIAKKRARRWPEARLPVGKYRKWNQTCNCAVCRKPRIKDKGHIKERNRNGDVVQASARG